jgi:cytochrome b6-f complex iron-sulfur subunit
MGTIPVANPSPPKRLGLPRRGLRITVILFAVIVAIAVGVAFVLPTGSKVDHSGGANWVTVGHATDFELFQPVRNTEHRFWLVKLGDEKFLALLTRDPRLGCTIAWVADLKVAGGTGAFRNPCHSQVYNLNGRCLSGPCIRGMDAFPVRIRGGDLQVDVAPTNVILGPPVAPGR